MKKEYQGQCIFCGQPISTKQVGVGYTKTKRKTVVLFHEICFYRVNEINKFDNALGIDGKKRIQQAFPDTQGETIVTLINKY